MDGLGWSLRWTCADLSRRSTSCAAPCTNTVPARCGSSRGPGVFPPNDRLFYPLLSTCIELGIPFLTQVGHAGPLRASEPGRPIPYLDQVALDFPELTIVGGHIGAPWTEEMISLARKYERVHICTSAYTAHRYPPELVAYLRSRGGRRKVIFGSGFPALTPSRALERLDDLGLDEEARELFLAGNARRVFELD